ncbi:hypothetical protein SAMN02799624_02836 [Paenibacillus sp. UNC496MF]|uniref:hypothetical protein n=1 Tax=Paenibacillus sp. UNC496MF TaxID=1502753 RepID=UPI0008EAECC2|nr:hypothetical protein [Paenibacillus sp. UNC496MF]SFI98078.1 hypothetical protein SAMN02799624_02836 [Paenibacillus sp. UNC496MF]
MVMPYAVSPVSEAVRPNDEPIYPLERYAMYPHAWEEGYPYRGKEGGRAASVKRVKPAGLLDLPASLPRGAGAALRAAAEHAAAWLREAGELRAALEALTQRFPPRPDSRRIVAAEGAAVGRAEPGAATGRFEVRIHSVARPQLNLGFDLVADAPSVVRPGQHGLRIRRGGVQEDAPLTIEVLLGDTNADVILRLRDAVHAADTGVASAVQEAPLDGFVRLALAASATGTANAFEPSDEPGSSLVNALGIGRIARPASDAVYAIDGGAATVSGSNAVPLPRLGAVLDLEQAAVFGSRVDVRVERDLAPLAERLRRVAAGANALRELHVRAGGALRPEPMRRIDDALAQAGAGAAGFRRSSAGAWRVDEAELRAAFGASEMAESLRRIAGPGGFAAALADEIDGWRCRPLDALLDLNGGLFLAFAQYGADAAPRTPSGLSGFRVDAAL